MGASNYMKKEKNEDNLYIEQFLSGEEKGFEMLVQKYQNRALNIVYSLLGKDRESEDITQEVFLKVYRHLRSFKERSLFSTWLYRIVVNTTYDFARRRRGFINNDEDILKNIVAGSRGPGDTLLLKEKEQMVQKALENVPFKFRVALVLKDIDGLSYVEIARVLRCRLGTVESRIYRARQFLKTELLKLRSESQ